MATVFIYFFNFGFTNNFKFKHKKGSTQAGVYGQFTVYLHIIKHLVDNITHLNQYKKYHITVWKAKHVGHSKPAPNKVCVTERQNIRVDVLLKLLNIGNHRIDKPVNDMQMIKKAGFSEWMMCSFRVDSQNLLCFVVWHWPWVKCFKILVYAYTTT